MESTQKKNPSLKVELIYRRLKSSFLTNSAIAESRHKILYKVLKSNHIRAA